MQYLFLTSFVFAKSCISDFFHDFQTDLLSIQEEMLCNPFLTSTISTCPLEYQLKMAFFCIFHIIFTGFSLSWTRRVLRQARIRDVKYYINSELSPVLKGVFPQTTGCTLESGPSLHSRSNCFWGDIALALHTPRRLRHEKNNGSEGKGQEIFLIHIQCDSLSMKNKSEWCDLRNTLCPQPFPPQKVSSDAMPALQQISETSNRTCIKGHWTRENTLFLKACKCKTFQILDLTQHNNYYCKVSPNK